MCTQMVMPTNNQPESGQQPQAAQHISNAHELLTELQKRIGQHPELAEALLKLETALSILSAKTGGML